jgi:hypothetical protein
VTKSGRFDAAQMSIRGDLRGPSRDSSGQPEVAPQEQVPWWTDHVIVVALAIGFTVVHVAVPGAVPTGADPGIWLAFAKERFGDTVMAAQDAAYLPGFPLLLGLLLTVGSSISAIAAAGVISKIAMVLAIYLVVRPVGLGYAAAAAVLIGLSGAHAEMYAWGGYIQQLGTALGLVAVFYLVRYLETRRSADLAVSAMAVAATLLTHNLVGGLLAGALISAVAHNLYLTRANRRRWMLGLRDAAILAVPAAGFVATYLLMGERAGRQPSLNPTGLSRAESVVHIFNEAPIPWLVVTALALTVALSRRWSGFNAATVAVGGGWLVVSVIFFLLIGEPRALLLTQMGLVVIAVSGYAALLRVAQEKNVYARDALIAVGGILLLTIVTSGYTDYDAAADYYRVVDHEEIAALDQLVAASDPGDLVVASEGEHGFQMGWWVTGYAERPTYPGGDVNFLASPQERAQGAAANRVFESDSSEAQALLEEIGARFLVVDRRGPDAAWLEDEFARSLRVVDGNSNLVVLELPKG